MPVPSWIRRWKNQSIRTPIRNHRATARPRLEALEDRAVPATFTVLNTIDTTNTLDVDYVGSLRWAISQANANAGPDTIEFDIPFSGVQTIRPLSALPTLTDAAGVVINGYSQDGASLNTQAIGNNALLRIELDGSLAGAGVDGLSVSGGNSTIAGLVVNRFGGHGIRLWNAGTNPALGNSNTIRGNFVGTDPTGTIDLGNGGDGVRVDTTSSNNTIGGTSAGDRNLISGNTDNGVNFNSSSAVGNVVLGNYLGTTASGMAPLGNGVVFPSHGPISNGVRSAGGNTIGGAAPGAGNLISGNLNNGVYIDQGFDDVIQGNTLSLNATATAMLRNEQWDVHLFASVRIVVGGTAAGAGNVCLGMLVGGPSAVVQGNYVGTNRDGTFVFESGGIRVGATNSLIGGTDTGAGNVIVKSFLDGIQVSGSGHVVQGNYIGTNPDGDELGNARDGVMVFAGATNNTIGGTVAGAGNTIAFNTGAGVSLRGSTGTGNPVRGNSIHDNGGLGIDLATIENEFPDGVTPNDVGDADTGANNLQNFSVITLAEPGAMTRVVGTLNSTPNSTFWLDFYANGEPDSLGYGEGQRYLGAISGTTDNLGNASFDAFVTGASTLGEFVSATATFRVMPANTDGSTSEFSFTAPIGYPASAFTVTHTGDTGAGSLRRALFYANFKPGLDTINFAIPGSGDHVITLMSPLPAITEAVTIDGYTQAGSQRNSEEVGSNADINVVLDGSNLSNDDGLTITGSGSTVSGLRFEYFETAIRIQGTGATGNSIAGNFIGTDGEQIKTGGWTGISIEGASDNTVGGTALADRNIIAVGGGEGVVLDGPLSDNVIEGNYIGLNAEGTDIIGGLRAGIKLLGHGLDNAFINNRISGHWLAGVLVDSPVGTSVTIQDNHISGGVLPIGYGILVFGGSRPTIERNTIAYNHGAGISVPAFGNQDLTLVHDAVIADNTIQNNEGTGIELNSSSAEVTGNTVTDNGGAGLVVHWFASDVLVEDNTFSGNGYGSFLSNLAFLARVDGNGPGVWVLGTSIDVAYNSGNTIRNNRIFGNAGLGIELGDIPTLDDGVTRATAYDQWIYSVPEYGFVEGGIPRGVTPNDTGDGDLGSNGAQNFPVLTDGRAGTQTYVSGTLNSTPNSTFTLDFYASDTADPSGYGEGGYWDEVDEEYKGWLGSITVTTDSSGNASFGEPLSGESSLGQWITATATAADGSTSEFSRAFQLDFLAIYGTDGNDTITVTPSGGSVQITVNGGNPTVADPDTLYLLGGGGNDTYTIQLGDLPGPVMVLDSAGQDDTLLIIGTDEAEQISKTTDPDTGLRQVRRLQPTVEAVDALGIERATVDGGAGDDDLFDPGADTVILGGPGNDTIVIADTTGNGVTADGGPGSDTYIVETDNLQGPVNITDTGTTGTDAVTVEGTPAADSITQTGNHVVANGGTITLAGADTLTVDGNGGTGDTFTVVGTPSIVPTVEGVSDTIVNGTAGNDTFVVTPVGNTGQITVHRNGQVIGTYRPTRRLVVHGLNGDDDLQVAGSISIPVLLYGDDGHDRLKGGDGDDILLGGNGNDEVLGGGGRDLMIGGWGADRLVGNGGDDMFIAGWTSHDGNASSLEAVMREWTRTDRTYSQRVAALRAGGGLNGTVALNATTVFSDSDEDVMTGSSGNDWFLYDSVRDRINGLGGGEFVDDFPYVGP